MNNNKPKMSLTYRYLNMNTMKFVDSNADFVDAFKGTNHLVRVMSVEEYGQVLVAAGSHEFSEQQALYQCRKLTGVL